MQVVNIDAYSPEQLTAFWSAVTAIAAVVAGAVAIVTLWALRQDSRDRTRPLIAIDLRPMPLARMTVELVVENVGQSVAKDVKIEFDPPVQETHGQMAAFVARRYSQVIPTLTPGRRLSNVYGHFTGEASGSLREAAPSAFMAKAMYEDAHGRSYTDTYSLTVATIRNQTTTSPASTDEEGLRRRLIEAVEAIAKVVGRH